MRNGSVAKGVVTSDAGRTAIDLSKVSTEPAELSGKYSVRVKDGAGTVVESDVCDLDVTLPAFILTKPLPEDKSINDGDEVSFEVGVSGGKKPYKVEWFYDDILVEGKTELSFSSIFHSTTEKHEVKVSVKVTDALSATVESSCQVIIK